MNVFLTNILKSISEFLAQRKGLPVMIGAGLVLLNFVIRLLTGWAWLDWLRATDLLLHVGIILGLFGVLLGDAL